MQNLFGIFVIMLWLSASAVWAGDYEDGLAAYNKLNYSVALEKFRLASALGVAKAQTRIGFLYQEGLGVQVDYKKAIHWYTLAITKSEYEAMFHLGFLYSVGYGVPQDYRIAHMWYNLAIANGDKSAVGNRQFVENKMTPQQIAEAQKLARECQARNFKNCD